MTATNNVEKSPAATEYSGGFGWFRKYQKVILYTAGIFTLFTFSITGAVYGLFGKIFAPPFRGAEMTVSGRVVKVTREDTDLVQALSRWGVGTIVALPAIASGDSDQNLPERYAALRRLAVEFGIEVSDQDVTLAIEQGLKIFRKVAQAPDATAKEFARAQRASSLTDFEIRVREALRIGTFLRLQALGADTTDAALADKMIRDNKLRTFRVAVYDKSAKADELEKEGITDEILQKWLADLDDEKKLELDLSEPNKVSLSAIGLVFDHFEAANFAEALEGKEFGEEELRQEYDIRKEAYFKKPETPKDSPEAKEEGEAAGGKSGESTEGGKEGKPDESEESDKGQPEAGDALDKNSASQKKDDGLGGKGGPYAPDLQSGDAQSGDAQSGDAQSGDAQSGDAQSGDAQSGDAQSGDAQSGEAQSGEAQSGEAQSGDAQSGEGAVIGPSLPETGEVQDPYVPFEEVKDRLLKMLQAEAVLNHVRNQKIQPLMAAHVAGQVDKRNAVSIELSDARKALADAEKEAAEDGDDEELKEAVETAKKSVEGKEEALEAAEDALDEQRRTFDFVAAVRKILGARESLKHHIIEEPTDADGLKELGLLGTWRDTFNATSMEEDGDVSTQIQTSDKASFHFQVPRISKNPLKGLDDIREKASEAYFAEKADDAAAEAKKKFEEVMDELARDLIKEKLAELEGSKKSKVDERFSVWEKKVKADLDKAVATRDSTGNPNSTAWKVWDKEVEKYQGQLDKKDEQRKEIEDVVGKEAEEETDSELAKVRVDVLDQAGERAGFAAKVVGPYLENLSSQPRFAERWSGIERAVFGQGSSALELEKGEATEIVDDESARVVYLAVSEAIEEATLKDLSRRQFLQARDSFVQNRLAGILQQSFTIDALETRFQYRRETAFEEGEKLEGDPGEGPSAPEDGAAGTGEDGAGEDGAGEAKKRP